MNWVKGVDSGGRYFTGFILEEVDWEGTAQIYITSCTVEDAVGRKVLMNKAAFKEYGRDVTHLTIEHLDELIDHALLIRDKTWFNSLTKRKNKLIGRLDTWKV